jgi:hypothetical protein
LAFFAILCFEKLCKPYKDFGSKAANERESCVEIVLHPINNGVGGFIHFNCISSILWLPIQTCIRVGLPIKL